MNRFGFSIRTSLLVIVSILCIAVITLASLQVHRAWTSFADAARVAESNGVSGLLLAAAGDWAVERGLSTTALADPKPAQAATIAAIEQRRESAEVALNAALKQVVQGPAFKDQDALVAAVAAAQAQVAELRTSVDKALAQPLSERDETLSQRWITAATGQIMASQQLRLAEQFVPKTIETQVSQIQSVRSAVWTLSEYAGRERALIGQAVSAGVAFDPAKLRILATYRGRVEQAWLEVESYLARAGSDPDVRAAATRVEQVFFGDFETLREKMYAAGIVGTPYPVNAEGWIADATAAIDTLLVLSRATGSASDRVVAASAGEAQTSMIMNGLVLMLGLTLAAAAYRVVMASVLRPMSSIVACMRELADGDLTVETPFVDRKNEIGEMARAVEVFKQNGIRIRDLNAQEAALQAKSADLQSSIGEVVSAAVAGDFGRRITKDYGNDDLNRFAEQVNDLVASVDRGIAETRRVMAALAEGDLTQEMTGEFHGAFAELKSNVNVTVASLRSVLAEVRTAVDTLDSGASEMRSASDDLSKRTERQAASLEETSSALEEITAAVNNSTERALEASRMVEEARTGTEQSSTIVQDAVSAMDEIENSSRQISSIIGMIDEIAFQTNLLALNAGVEAARAGEAGKGFAVVAQEVRELAQRSASAAKEIKDLISRSNAEVGSGVRLVTATGDALRAIQEQVVNINEHVQSIATAAKEQSTGLSEVNIAVNHMDEVTQQNAAMVEESTAATSRLAEEASNLARLIARFKLDGNQRAPKLADADSRPVVSPAHLLGKRLASAMSGRATAQSEQWAEF